MHIHTHAHVHTLTAGLERDKRITAEREAALAGERPYTRHPAPCTLLPTPISRHPTAYSLQPGPAPLDLIPYTLHPTPYNPKSQTQTKLEPQTLKGGAGRRETCCCGSEPRRATSQNAGRRRPSSPCPQGSRAIVLCACRCRALLPASPGGASAVECAYGVLRESQNG